MKAQTDLEGNDLEGKIEYKGAAGDRQKCGSSAPRCDAQGLGSKDIELEHRVHREDGPGEHGSEIDGVTPGKRVSRRAGGG